MPSESSSLRDVPSAGVVDLWLSRHGAIDAADIVSRYSKSADAQVRHGRFGQPLVSRTSARVPRAHISVSHSGGRSVIAVARHRVGIDLEGNEQRSLIPFVQRYLSEEERVAIASADPQLQAAALRRCWTRREAYAKATGRGLSLGLSRFRVDVHDGRSDALTFSDRRAGEAERWRFADVDVGAGWTLSIALHGRTPVPQLFDLDG